MILGLGSDIRRIKRAIARHGDRFVSCVLIDTERAKAIRRTEKTQAAARLAAITPPARARWSR